MAPWVPYLVGSTVLWALHVGTLRALGERLPPAQITFVFYVFALLTTVVVLLVDGRRLDVLALAGQYRLLGLLALAGISIGLVDYLFVRGLAFGAPLHVYSPLFSTIGLSLIALIGIFYFGEALTFTKLSGIVLACMGIFLLSR